MTSRIYDPRQDTTMKDRHIGTGMAMLKMCSACHVPKSSAGGRTNKRTRQWSCAGCVTLADAFKAAPVGVATW